MKEVIKLIEKHVSERQIDRHQGLNVLCDFLIDMFDVRHFLSKDGFFVNCRTAERENPYLFKIAMIWMNKVADAIAQGSFLDFFGGVYEEMYQSRGKASTLGQFFTPASVCELMAKMIDNGGYRVNDPSCGSGRTLLAVNAIRRMNGKDGYYVGEDIDTASVKMCSLNMMMHGMHGRVVRHDTLMEPNTFDYGFEINEVRYPFPSPFYSIRKIECKALEVDFKEKESGKINTANKVSQLSLF